MTTSTNVLLIDDDADTREMMTFLLRARGFGVESAANGIEGVRRARERRPCVILLDLMMPDLDGEEVHRQLRADQRVRDVPVICISGKHDAVDIAQRLGCHDCFPKPIDFEAMITSIRGACRCD